MCASFMAHIYFHIEDGFEQYDRRKWPYYVLGILIVVALGYGAAIFLAPKLPVFGNSIEATEKYYQDNQCFIKYFKSGLRVNCTIEAT